MALLRGVEFAGLDVVVDKMDLTLQRQAFVAQAPGNLDLPRRHLSGGIDLFAQEMPPSKRGDECICAD